MRRVFVVLFMGMVAACGGGGSGSLMPAATAAPATQTAAPATTAPATTAPTAGTTSSPSPSGPAFLDLCADDIHSCELVPGIYRPSLFRPALRFVLTEPYMNTADRLTAFGLKQDGLEFIFAASPVQGVDSKTLFVIDIPVGAAAFIAYLQGRSELTVSAPTAITMLGAAGIQVDITTARKTSVNTFSGPSFSWSLEPAMTARYIAVDVGDTTVVIAFETKAADFDRLLPKAQTIIDSIVFE